MCAWKLVSLKSSHNYVVASYLASPVDCKTACLSECFFYYWTNVLKVGATDSPTIRCEHYHKQGWSCALLYWKIGHVTLLTMTLSVLVLVKEAKCGVQNTYYRCLVLSTGHHIV